MKKFWYKAWVVVLTFVIACSVLVGCEQEVVESEQQEIKNVVIIIGDGCGLEHIEAGEIYEGKDYAFTNWHQTTVNTDSINSDGGLVLTDSAAGGTAISTGSLTKNGYVGVDSDGKELTTVMDLAIQKGKATGVVTTDTIYGATPASFSGHAPDRNNKEQLVTSQFQTSNIDLLCGADDSYVLSRMPFIEQNGYSFLNNYKQIAQTMDDEKVYWQFNMAGKDATVPLDEVTAHALEYLSKDEDGFVLMIEQAYIDKYSHNNDFEGMLQSVISLNKTVETVMKWIGDRKDTAVLVTADHETGDFFVGRTQPVWNSKSHTAQSGGKMYYSFFTTDHTRKNVGLFVYGIQPDFSAFTQFSSNTKIKNIETNQIIVSLLNAK